MASGETSLSVTVDALSGSGETSVTVVVSSPTTVVYRRKVGVWVAAQLWHRKSGTWSQVT